MNDNLVIPTPNKPLGLKQRHGCLTMYLTWLVVAYVVAIIIQITALVEVGPVIRDMPFWFLLTYMLPSLFKLICVIALFRWKRWAFWGLLCSAPIVAVFNIIKEPIFLVIFLELIGLMAVFLLIGVLHIGGEKKGWSQLE